MIFVRGRSGTRGFLKNYSYFRLSVGDYPNMNQRRFTNEVVKQEMAELTYRVVMIDKYKGRVSWRNCTGNYVSLGQVLCDIISDDKVIHSIKAPIAGMIANRFVDEGVTVSEHSLICLLKVCTKPTPSIDRQSYLFERRLYSRVSGEMDVEESEERRELEIIFGEQKRFRAKDFILPVSKEDDEENLEHLIGEESGKIPADIPQDVLDKRRKDEFEKYTSQEIRDEMKRSQIDKDLSAIQHIDRASNEFYKQLLDENFASINKQQLQIVYGSERSQKFLHISTDIDLTNAFQYALNEGERNNVKFELKYLVLLGCLRAFRDLPVLINSKDKSINITMGLIAGGKLNFPLLKNLEKYNTSTLKEKLLKVRANLIDGKDIDGTSEKRADYESLAITNEWDYGFMTGPSCLYLSRHANLSLNGVTIKPRILDDYKVHYLPIMSPTLTFNNDKIDGQEALLFLNKLKETIEQLQYN